MVLDKLTDGKMGVNISNLLLLELLGIKLKKLHFEVQNVVCK